MFESAIPVAIAVLVIFAAWLMLSPKHAASSEQDQPPLQPSSEIAVENNKHLSTEPISEMVKLEAPPVASSSRRVELRVYFGSTTGTAKRFSSLIAQEAPTTASVVAATSSLSAGATSKSTAAAALLAKDQDQGGGECCGGSGPAATEATAAEMARLVVGQVMSCDGADAWDLLEPSEEDLDDPHGGDPGTEDGATVTTELVVVVIMSTWTGGAAPVTAQRWCEALEDMASDFRVGSSALHGARFAVYGLGSALYDEDWCTPAETIHGHLESMGAKALVPVGKGDDQADMEAHFDEWRANLWASLKASPTGSNASAGGGACGCKSTETTEAKAAADGSDGKDGNESNSTSTSAPVKRGKKVIKGDASRLKKSKEQRRREAAAKGSVEAASRLGSVVGGEVAAGALAKNTATAGEEDSAHNVEMMPEDKENDRLLLAADMEDSDADSDQELEEDGVLVPVPNAAGKGGGGGSDDETNAQALAGVKSGESKEEEEEKSALTGMEIGYDDGEEGGDGDMEDLGRLMLSSSSGGEKKEQSKDVLASLRGEGEEQEQEGGGEVGLVDTRPAMVTPLQRKALTKEGYKIIGTHSAVKLCRWTKHQLRGRGGCYKHTFYGITSYQCMEATPSLACANKCVFCWRHHKNPVGKEWRWREDAPELIVKEAVDLHVRMVNEFKGAVGVKPERIQEAFTVRHCALSLVGEPIMYPRINELVQELHKRKISSFLVTNAQFPSQIENLVPVTQLYVSIDAATKESLKAVDRPLFKDYWERFLGCLTALKGKGQRTVYRLTLVKKLNMAEVDQYAELLKLGEPDLIEIKAVTYCGTSDASDLTMDNVPWHHEVVAFALALCERTGGVYGLAAEHAHSCCTLLARKEIYLHPLTAAEAASSAAAAATASAAVGAVVSSGSVSSNGTVSISADSCHTPVGFKWRTWIDYPKFHELEERFRLTGETFTSRDYLADTPAWALAGAAEGGFDPVESRVRRNRKGAVVPVDYKSSESGCG